MEPQSGMDGVGWDGMEFTDNLARTSCFRAFGYLSAID